MVEHQAQVDQQGDPPQAGLSRQALLRLYGDVSRTSPDVLDGLDEDGFISNMLGNEDAQGQVQELLLQDEGFKAAGSLPATPHELFSDLEAYYPETVAGTTGDEFAQHAKSNPDYLGGVYDALAEDAPLVLGRTTRENFIEQYAYRSRPEGLSAEEIAQEKEDVFTAITKGTRGADGEMNYDQVVVANEEEAAAIAEKRVEASLATREVEQLKPEELHDLVKGEGSYGKRKDRARRFAEERNKALSTEANDTNVMVGDAILRQNKIVFSNMRRGLSAPVELDADIVRSAKDLDELNEKYPGMDINASEFLSAKSALLGPEQMAVTNEARMLGLAASTYKRRGVNLREQLYGEVEGLTPETYEALVQKINTNSYLSADDKELASKMQATSAFKSMQMLQKRYDEVANRFDKISIENKELAAFDKYKEELKNEESKEFANSSWLGKRAIEMGQFFTALSKAPQKIESFGYSLGSLLRIDFAEQALVEMNTQTQMASPGTPGQFDRAAVSKSSSYTSPEGVAYEVDYKNEKVTGIYDAKTGEPVSGEILAEMSAVPAVSEGWKDASNNINGSSAMAMASSTMGDIALDIAVTKGVTGAARATLTGGAQLGATGTRIAAAASTIANHWGTATLDALNSGNLDPENAALVGLSDAVLESTMEMVTGRVSGFTVSGTTAVTRKLGGRTGITGSQVRAAAGKLTRKDQAYAFAGGILKQQAEEQLEENFTTLVSGYRNSAANAYLGGEFEDVGMASSEEFLSTILVTAMATALPGTMQGASDLSKVRHPGFFRDAAMKLVNDERSKSTFIETIDNMAANGKISDAESSALKESMLGLAEDMEGVMQQAEGVENDQVTNKVDHIAGAAMEYRMLQARSSSNPNDKKLKSRMEAVEAELNQQYSIFNGLLSPTTADEVMSEIENNTPDEPLRAEDLEDSYVADAADFAAAIIPDNGPIAAEDVEQSEQPAIDPTQDIVVDEGPKAVVSTLSVPMFEVTQAARNNGGSIKVGVAGGREATLFVDANNMVSLDFGVSGSIEVGSEDNIYNQSTDDFRITGVSRNNDNSESASYVTTEGETYAVTYQDPQAAIDYDENGNFIGVDLYRLTRNTGYFEEGKDLDVRYERQYVSGEKGERIARALEARSLVGLRVSNPFLAEVNDALTKQRELESAQIIQKLETDEAEAARLQEQGKLAATGGTTPAEGGSVLNTDLGPDGARVTANDQGGDTSQADVQPAAEPQQETPNDVPSGTGSQPVAINPESEAQPAPSSEGTAINEGEGDPEAEGVTAAAVEAKSMGERIAEKKRNRDYEILNDRARKTALAKIKPDKTTMPSDPRELDDKRIPNRIIEAGATIVRPPIVENKVLGSKVAMVFGANHSMQGRWRLAEADDLFQSHESNGMWNQRFFNRPMQPKDRGDTDSINERMAISSNLDPKRITKENTIYFGSPVVNHRGEVIQGNNRTGAIKDAYFSKDAEGYREWLRSNAADFGLTSEDVDSVSRPVLVREVILPDSEATLIGQTQITDMESGNVGELSDTRVVTSLDLANAFPGLVNVIFTGLAGKNVTLTKAVQVNKNRIARYLAQHVPSQFLGIFDTDATPGQIAAPLEKILIEGILGTMDFRYKSLLKNLDSESRIGLIMSLPVLSRLPKKYDLLEMLPQAMKLAAEVNKNADVAIGGIVGVNKHLAQQSAVDVEVYSGAAKAVAALILSPDSALDIKNYFDQYAQIVQPKGVLAVMAPVSRTRALNSLNSLIAQTESGIYRNLIDNATKKKPRYEARYGSYTEDVLLKQLPEIKESDFDPDFIEVASQTIAEDNIETVEDRANTFVEGETVEFNDKEVARAADGSWRYMNKDGGMSGRNVAKANWEQLDKDLIAKMDDQVEKLKKQAESERAAAQAASDLLDTQMPEDGRGVERKIELNGTVYNFSDGNFDNVAPGSKLDAELRVKLDRLESDESASDSQLKAEATTANNFLDQVLSQVTFQVDEETNDALRQLVHAAIAAKALRDGVSFDQMLEQFELVEVQDLGALEASGADLSGMDIAEIELPDGGDSPIPRIGAFVVTNGKAPLRLIISPGANAGTILHEMAHSFEPSLTAKERTSILEWLGHDEWTRETSEGFAKGYELWLREGNQKLMNEGIKEPTKAAFRKFSEYMKKVMAWATRNRVFSPAVVDVYRDMSGLPPVGHSGKAKGITPDGKVDAVHVVESSQDQEGIKQDYSELSENQRELLTRIPPRLIGQIGSYDGVVAHIKHIEANIQTMLADDTFDGSPVDARNLTLDEQNTKLQDRLAAKNTQSLFSTGLLSYNQRPADFQSLQEYVAFAKAQPARVIMETVAGPVALSGDFSQAQLNEVFRLLQPSSASYSNKDGGGSAIFQKSKVDAAMRYNKITPKVLGPIENSTGVTLLDDTGALIGRIEVKDASVIGRVANSLGAATAYLDNSDNTVAVPQNNLLEASLGAAGVNSNPISQADPIVTTNRYSSADSKVADAAVGVLMATPSLTVDRYAKLHKLDAPLTELIRQRLLESGREGGQTKRARYSKAKLKGRKKLIAQGIIHMQNNPRTTLAEMMTELGLFELNITEQDFPDDLRKRGGRAYVKPSDFDTDRDQKLMNEGLGLMEWYDDLAPSDLLVQIGSTQGWDESVKRLLKDPNLNPEVQGYIASGAGAKTTVSISGSQELAEKIVGGAVSSRQITQLAADAISNYQASSIGLDTSGGNVAVEMYVLHLLSRRAQTRGLPRLSAAINLQIAQIRSSAGLALSTARSTENVGTWATIGAREARAREMSLDQVRGGKKGMTFNQMAEYIWDNVKLSTQELAEYGEEIARRGRGAFKADREARQEAEAQVNRSAEDIAADNAFFKQEKFKFSDEGLGESGVLFSTPSFEDLPLETQERLRERALAAYWNSGLLTGRARQAFKKGIDPALAEMWDDINAEAGIASQIFDLRVERDLNRMLRHTNDQIAKVVSGTQDAANARQQVFANIIKAARKRRTGDASGVQSVTADDYKTARKALLAKADSIMTLETAIEQSQIQANATNDPKDLEVVILLQDILATVESNTDTKSPAGMRRLINKELKANNRKFADLAVDKILNNGVKGAVVKALMEHGLDAQTAKLYEKGIREAYDATVGPVFARKAERAALEAFSQGLGVNGVDLRNEIADLEKQRTLLYSQGKNKEAKKLDRKIAAVNKQLKEANRYAKSMVKSRKGKMEALANMLAFGSFTDPGLPEHIASIFGHDVMSGNNLAELERLTKDYDQTIDPREKRRLRIEIEKYLQNTGTGTSPSHKALIYYLEYVYQNMLSSFETAGAALLGNLDATINKVFIPETLRSMKAVLTGVKSGDFREVRFLSDAIISAGKTVPTGLKAWGDVITTGVTDVNITDMDQKRIKAERPLFESMVNAVKGYKDPGTTSKVKAAAALLPAVILSAQQLATRTLYGVDAFSNIVVKPFIAERSAQYKALENSQRSFFSSVSYNKTELEMLEMIDTYMGKTIAAKQETSDIIRMRRGLGPNANVDPKSREYVELLAEVSERYMDEDIYNQARDMSQQLAGMGTVYGPMGMIINPMINLKQSSLNRVQKYQDARAATDNDLKYTGQIMTEYALQTGLAMLMPFARVVGVMGGLAIKAQPFALANLKRNEDGDLTWPHVELKNTKTKWNGLTVEEDIKLNKYEIFANQVLAIGPTTVAMMALGLLFDFESDEEEPVEGLLDNLKAGSRLVPNENAGIRVTGSGRGISYGRLTNLSGQGWKPHEVQRLDRETGKWSTVMSYRNSTIGGTLAWLGHITDSNEFESTINSGQNTSAIAQIGYAPVSYAMYVSQVGFVQSSETVGAMFNMLTSLMSGKDGGSATEIAKVRLASTAMRPIVPGGNLGNYMEKVNQQIFASSPKTGTVAGSRVAGDILSNSFFYSWAFDKSRYDPYGYEQTRPWRVEGTAGAVINPLFNINEDRGDRPGRDFLNKHSVGNQMTPFYPQREEKSSFGTSDEDKGLEFVVRSGITDDQVLEMQDQSYQHRRAMIEAQLLKEDNSVFAENPWDLKVTTTAIRDNANEQAKAHQTAKLLEGHPEWKDAIKGEASYLVKPEIPSPFIVRADKNGKPQEYKYSHLKRLMSFYGFRIDGDQVTRTKVSTPEGVTSVKEMAKYSKERRKRIKSTLTRKE